MFFSEQLVKQDDELYNAKYKEILELYPFDTNREIKDTLTKLKNS